MFRSGLSSFAVQLSTNFRTQQSCLSFDPIVQLTQNSALSQDRQFKTWYAACRLEDGLKKDRKDARRDPTDIVGPYARIRAIVAVVLFLIALGVIGYRSFSG